MINFDKKLQWRLDPDLHIGRDEHLRRIPFEVLVRNSDFAAVQYANGDRRIYGISQICAAAENVPEKACAIPFYHATPDFSFSFVEGCTINAGIRGHKLSLTVPMEAHVEVRLTRAWNAAVRAIEEELKR